MNEGFYYIIPAQLVEAGNPTKALLYGLITSLANRTGFCWASNKILAEKLKRGERIIRQYLSELEAEGWIKIQHGNSKERKIFLNMPFVEEKEEKDSIQPGNSETKNQATRHSISTQPGNTLPEKPPKPGNILPHSNINKSNIKSNINTPQKNFADASPPQKKLTVRDFAVIFDKKYKSKFGQKFVFTAKEMRFIKLLLSRLKTKEKFEKIIDNCLSDKFYANQISPTILYSKLNYFLNIKKSTISDYDPLEDEKKWKNAGFTTADEIFNRSKNERVTM